MEQIDWHDSEWADEGFAAYLKGYDADVFRTDDDPRIGWSWTVKATSSVSEWPELQDTGWNRTASAAKNAAERSLRKAAENAPAINPNTGERNEW